MGVILFMGVRYVRSEGASAPELFARVAGVPAHSCALDGVECPDLPDGAQAYVGVFDAADVQGRFSGLWIGMSCLRGAWAVEFGADGLECALPGPVEVSWGWLGMALEDALFVQWYLEVGRVLTDQGHDVVNELAERSLYARVLYALDVNLFFSRIASREGEVLVQHAVSQAPPLASRSVAVAPPPSAAAGRSRSSELLGAGSASPLRSALIPRSPPARPRYCVHSQTANPPVRPPPRTASDRGRQHHRQMSPRQAVVSHRGVRPRARERASRLNLL